MMVGVGMLKQNRIMLAIAATVFLAIVVLETVAPANIVGAYGFVLPILLVATLRSRPVMLATVVACIAATYIRLMQPTKPGRFQAAVINRSVVAGVLLIVAYIGMTWEERKTREEAARAGLRAGNGKSPEGQFAAGRCERSAESLGTLSRGGPTGGFRGA